MSEENKYLFNMTCPACGESEEINLKMIMSLLPANKELKAAKLLCNNCGKALEVNVEKLKAGEFEIIQEGA